MGTNECSQPASKSSWDSQDFGDVNMVLKMLHFHKSSRPQWVNQDLQSHTASLGPNELIENPYINKICFLIIRNNQYATPPNVFNNSLIYFTLCW